MSKVVVTRGTLSIVASDVVNLVLRKNADYGDAWQTHGITGVAVRLSDKLLRLKKLSDGTEALVIDESIKDTLQDIIGYALLGLLYLDNLSSLPKATVSYDTDDINATIARAELDPAFDALNLSVPKPDVIEFEGSFYRKDKE